MPKATRVCSTHSKRSRTSPIPCCSKDVRQDKSKNCFEPDEDVKEWEEVRCPICMEHPHSAVLLRCSSYEKGCHPYICNTSHRHSNCLSQFRKQNPKLVCPLCRGKVSEWVVIEPARQFMNSKPRNCYFEACDFSGTYIELRNHTRREHPASLPSEVGPARQPEWTRLEIERELNELQDFHPSSQEGITLHLRVQLLRLAFLEHISESA